MRPSRVVPTLALTISFAATTTALQASTSSPCAAQCGNSLDSTTGSDIVCTDGNLTSTSAGLVFQTCLSCQIESSYVDPVTQKSDLYWAIYNLRYALSWCLFGYPDNQNVAGTPCTTSTACGALESGFEFDSLSSNTSSYGFCAFVPTISVPRCTACLQVQATEIYLTNFVTTLDAACQQQPAAGQKVNIAGNLFSTTLVNVTSGVSTPANSYQARRHHGLTLGAKVGVAVGALVAVLAITGFCIVWRGKRRRRAFLLKHQQQSGYSDWVAQQRAASTSAPTPRSGGFFDSPQSQRPLVSSAPWARGPDDESPASAAGEQAYHFSPYSSHYSSPLDGNDQLPPRGREKTGEVLAERIEMQNVAPILQHPGHGRSRPLAAAGEEDATNGHVA
ncbi:LPXTG-domain-containing protein [Diplocarpon rosae]|nr:LPXTG-domain-containing protein [Diplocarpon rosae]